MNNSGLLDVSDGHRIFWRTSGPEDAPVFLVVHGGPGTGSDRRALEFFDLATTRVVQIDQRGAGRSLPAGELGYNTTSLLLDDMEAVRRHLGIVRWAVLAGSWGTTLALLHAGENPEACDGLVLRGVTEWTPDKYDWALRHRRFLAPEAHCYLLELLDPAEREDVLTAYYDRILADDAAAAARWTLYEQYFAAPTPPSRIGDEAQLPADFQARARIHVAYWRHGAFLAPGRMDRALAGLHGVPAHIVQGSLDLICPPLFAIKLAERLPGALLQIVPGGGHSAYDPGIALAVKAAVAQVRSKMTTLLLQP